MTAPEVINPVEQPSLWDNEIQSPLGRAFFDTVFHGGISAEVGLAGFKLADAVTDSGVAQISITGAAVVSGLALSIALKRFSR